MDSLLFAYIIVCSVGLIAGVLGGIIGFGTTIILMPLLVHFFGPLQAVPIVALVAIVANVSRVFIWLKAIDWRVCIVYNLCAVPSVILGANTLVMLSPRLIDLILGCFLLFMIPIRRWLRKIEFQLKLWHMAIVGAFIGYLTGVVASTGAINTPFFLAYGLTKGAFIGTEAASSLIMFVAKGITFHQLGVLNSEIIGQGLLIGAFVLIGSAFSKRFVLNLPEKVFLHMMEAVMLVSSLSILAMAW
jgi:uncharacterized membrane protein YfcA